MGKSHIFCPHCLGRIHLTQQDPDVKVDKMEHSPNCKVCGEFNHYTKDHQAYEDARAVAS